MSRVFTWDGSFELLSNETLLEGLERQGYEVEYQCRAGYCGSCRTVLLDGEVEYLTEPLAFLAPDEILPCCCRPAPSARVDIEVRQEQGAPVKAQDHPAQSENLSEELWAKLF